MSFITRLRKLQIQHKYAPNSIFALDETACWFNMPSDTTIASTDSRSVAVKSTGHEKDHSPWWWNRSIAFNDYLRKVIGQLTFNKRILVWDAYKCHISETTCSELDRLKLHSAVVPGGCTKFIQAADVMRKASFKSHLQNSDEVWLSEPTANEFTKGGNLKAPSHALMCQWVESAWDATESVTKSFLSCAITTSTDGSDNREIHCFKPNQPCSETGPWRDKWNCWMLCMSPQKI